MKQPLQQPLNDRYMVDVLVVGAGLIGLTIALEMQARGARVTVVERGLAMQQASTAAAGMLAVHDPGNPFELLEFSRMSAAMYPAFLQRIEGLSGVAVPFQTETAVQHYGAEVTRLEEYSLDPRQLATGVLAAAQAAGIEMIERAEVVAVDEHVGGLRVRQADGVERVAQDVVFACGAWSANVLPMKGQMLRVKLPEGFVLNEVHRNEQVYVVPRRMGPHAGTALIGATVEDVGFDTVVHAGDLARLRAAAAVMVPELESELEAPRVEAWAGLRPATADGLPVIGTVGSRRWIASGHYRNGVLLAPATALVMADMVMGETTELDLRAFVPGRFEPKIEGSRRVADIRAAAGDNGFKGL